MRDREASLHRARISRREFIKRTGATGVGLGALGLIASACQPRETGAPSPSAAATVVRGGHIVEGNTGDVKSLNPVLANAVFDQTVSGLLFDGLLTQAPDSSMVALIAELPKVSADNLTYTFNLRKDVKWSDGKPLTSDDVVFTYELFYHPKYSDVNSIRRSDLQARVASLTAPDPSTVVFTLKAPYAPFLAVHGQYGIVPKHVLGNVSGKEINTAPFNTAPSVVNGTFKFSRWDAGQQIVLERNDSYYRGPANLDRYVYKIIPDAANLANQLKTGEVDFASVDPALVEGLKGTPAIELVTFLLPAIEFYYHQLDPAKPASRILGEKAVRQALLFAIDRQQIVDAVYFGYASVAESVQPPSSWGFNADVKPKYRKDLAKANALLDGAGWKRGSDGVREKNGVPMKFEIVTSNVPAARRAVAQVMQQSWKEIGADTTLNVVERTALNTNFNFERRFDVMLTGHTLFPDPTQAILWNSRGVVQGGVNAAIYKNAEIDRILDAADAVTDQAKRKEFFSQAQDILADELPAAPVVALKGIFGVSKRVRNLGLSTYTYNRQRPYMKDVFVTDGK